MVWHMFSLESSFRQYMFPNPDISEAERNVEASYQGQVKTWFGSVAFAECHAQYESGRKMKRTLLWKSENQSKKEQKMKKSRRRKAAKILSRLQTLHWLIEQQFLVNGASLNTQLNSTSATNTNLIRLCVALNNIFTHRIKGDAEKYSLPFLFETLKKHLETLQTLKENSPSKPEFARLYDSAQTLFHKLKTEHAKITLKATEYANTVKGAIALDKDGWDPTEVFDPDVV